MTLRPLPHPVTGQEFATPVPPGTGWPDDPADADTPVASSAADVVRLASGVPLAPLEARISVCRACPRLVAWREQAAEQKRASYDGQPYWGRPVPGWGADAPGVLVVGLAPAANGGNRTGRNFTGDPSADWLHASLHRTGLATQATSEHAGDGQRLLGARMVAAVRCAPPANKPSPSERATCAPWLRRELTLVLPSVRAVVCLGAIGWNATWVALGEMGLDVPRPRPRFGHGVEVPVGEVTVLGCYHPSPHNTFTGRLTTQMMDAVFARARSLAG